ELRGNPVVSFVDGWDVVPSGAAALHAVIKDSFDPASYAVIQREPGIPRAPGTTPGTVSYERVNPQELIVRTRTNTPRLVLIHDSFDSGWTYSVDGSAPRHVLAADYFLQADRKST